MLRIQRFAAFSMNELGGNPAGVAICDSMPSSSEMQSLAAQVGYSETVFAAPEPNGWRVRYFAPEIEIPFCGHATIALGAALATHYGDGVFALRLNDGAISVEGRVGATELFAALQSPPTRSEAAPLALRDDALALFGYSLSDLDPRLPPAIIEAGARHLALCLLDRRRLAAMRYTLSEGRTLMRAHGFATISLITAETATLLHTRNAFAAGGVYEDPATGAAAAAWAGYLRDLAWPHGGAIELIQGEDMNVPCRLRVEITPVLGAGVRVSGSVRRLGA